MKLEIIRLESTMDATRGILRKDGNILACTLELPWRANTKSVSCIPVGIYCCVRIRSPRYGNVFQVMDIRNRTNILIHVGNTVDDTDGCILLGQKFGLLGPKRAVLSSKDAFSQFMSVMASHDQFALEIIRA